MQYTEQQLKDILNAISGGKDILGISVYVNSIFFKVSTGNTFGGDIHYEIYKKHIELHFEGTDKKIIDFFREELPADDKFEWGEHSFAIYYRLRETSGIQEVEDDFSTLYNRVNPVVEKYAKHLSVLVDIANGFSDFYKQEKEKQPYHINLIDELHANENAHTRILVKLLQYKKDGKYVLLQSFVNVLAENCTNMIVPEIRNPEIHCNREYIDALIEEKGKYGIIIENKIHGATDQYQQIERYIRSVLSRGVKREDVWVVYLTRDGSKEIEEHSLSAENREGLGERLVELNYRKHILPWLKEIALSTSFIQEEWLISALKQYIDHLEGLFNQRSSTREIEELLANYILDKYNVNRNDPKEVYEVLREQNYKIQLLSNRVGRLYGKSKRIVIQPFIEQTKAVYKELGIPAVQVVRTDNFIQVYPSGWDESIHFEWIIFTKSLIEQSSYRLDFHIEGNDNEKLKDYLKKDLSFQNALQKIENVNIELVNGNKMIFFSKPYLTPDALPFLELSQERQQKFLKEVYTETLFLIKIVNKFLEENSLIQNK